MALDGATFSAAPGRIVGFLGPNGAGKTTTMRAIFGLVRPNRGEFAASPSAPMVMIVRMANGGVPAWQIALSIVLMLAATAGSVRLASRIYEGTVLRTGRPVKLKEAWRGGET